MFKRSFLERMLMNEAGNEGGAGGSGGAGDEGGKNNGGDGGQGTGGSGEGGSGDAFDLSKQPKEVQDLVKSLRSENAKNRITNKAMADELEKMKKGFKSIFGESDEDDEAPEAKVQKLSSHAEALEMKNALLELAVEHGVGKDQREYFEFLMSKALDSLEEGEEMTEEQFDEILAKIKTTGSKGAGNTSVDDKNQGGKKPDGQTGTTLEQFMAMSITQKSKLFTEKPDVYNTLMGQAKSKKLI